MAKHITSSKKTMRRNSLIIDSGYFIAIFNKTDTHHDRALALREQIKDRPWITTWPVLTEVCHLLSSKSNPSIVEKFIKACQSPNISIYDLGEARLSNIVALMKKYRQLPMDLADASLVLLAEDLENGDIVSTDKRDFETYKWKNHKPFNNLLIST